MTDDTVGYGKPPMHTRWKKGQSGNPRGRPKGVGDFKNDLFAELAQVIQITEGGKAKRITKQRALVKALTTSSIKGDTRAANILIALCARVIEANPELRAEHGPSAADQKIVADHLARQIAIGVAAKLAEIERLKTQEAARPANMQEDC
jgi:hypothetical protein